MPLFDYQCKSCGNQFEILCKISERNNLYECPNCSSNETHQVILSSPSLVSSMRIGMNPKQREFREVLNKIHKRTPGSTLNQTTDIG